MADAASAFTARSGRDTRRIGRLIGGCLRSGDVVLLYGPLGAGKTTLAQGIGEALHAGVPVTSPTFALIHEYPADHGGLIHMDPYRLAGEDDLLGIGFEEYLERDSVLVVEWPERLGDLTPPDALRVRLERSEGQERTITLHPTGPRSAAVAAAVAAARAPRQRAVGRDHAPHPARGRAVRHNTHQERSMPITGVQVLERTTQPLLRADRPWEDFCIGWCSVLRDGARWRMWYDAYDHDSTGDPDDFLCYAESEDGVAWHKPDLDVVPYGSHQRTNIVISGRATGGVHGATVFIDPGAPAAERYKAVFTRGHGPEMFIYGAASPDGLVWQHTAAPILARNSDTQTVCMLDGGVYRMYVRMWTGRSFQGKRIVGVTESPTFGDFPEPRVILAPDDGDPDDLQFYNSAAAKLQDGTYLLLPSAFYIASDTVMVHMAAGDRPDCFVRVGREPAIPLGDGFDSRGMYVSPAAIPAGEPDEYWLYYNGTNKGHDEKTKDNSTHADGIGRMRVRLLREG